MCHSHTINNGGEVTSPHEAVHGLPRKGMLDLEVLLGAVSVISYIPPCPAVEPSRLIMVRLRRVSSL